MLVVGGCRSGKSSFAEAWASGRFTGKTYVATTLAGDDEEMQRRVAVHRQNRGADWRTSEEPLNIAGVLRQQWRHTEVFLIDCLTLWLTNLLLQDLADEEILARVDDLAAAIRECPVSVVLVANEVGLGIVPEAPLARRFRDLAGWCNQRIGACCDQVVFMAAGLPLYLK
ncbi:MAG: bifunctional adenosylcobinamide kinase/adenosylcobinamide-phosphate guanylyltransferase [Desulfurivibrio sp.]|jgi:adenosylcobinamide kinase/adenosylcobinamide-phosphate guanylyltransferase|nr:MAG: bifunctional adenosylcobinamide kinase/adenosylcobinamide-phosphate guanylyltransferase [Desulfurivibrio sp.]